VNAFKTSGGLPQLDNFDDTDVTWESEYTGTLDPRIDHTLGRPGILYKGFKRYGTDFVRDLSYAGPYFSKKHVAEPDAFGVGGWGNLSANNYRIMRYGMILLWLAEAEVELGNLERARELVNQIRTRASNPEGFVPEAIQGADRNDFTIVEGEPAANYEIALYNTPFPDAETARKAVRFESRLEFAMEGHRFFDLQRWGISAEVLNAYLQSGWPYTSLKADGACARRRTERRGHGGDGLEWGILATVRQLSSYCTGAQRRGAPAACQKAAVRYPCGGGTWRAVGLRIRPPAVDALFIERQRCPRASQSAFN
jgi:GH15 family glucan-1,4-alpha-glucosidase